jgi:hypothetical protein
MGTLLEAIGIRLEIHFWFRFRNGSLVGDNLRNAVIIINLTSPWNVGILQKFLEEKTVFRKQCRDQNGTYACPMALRM